MSAPADAYVRSFADTLRVVREYAAEMRRAAAQRERGHALQADLRADGAETALSVHARGVREQHGADTARDWIARARGVVAAETIARADEWGAPTMTAAEVARRTFVAKRPRGRSRATRAQ